MGVKINLQTMVTGALDAPQDDVIRIRYGSGDWPHHLKHRLYEEQIVPMASPNLAAQNKNWWELPRIYCTGPRPNWADLARHLDIPTTPVPSLVFDTFGPALNAAKRGLGVLPTSVPLARSEVQDGALVALTQTHLPHHESYWVLADEGAISPEKWRQLTAALK